MNAGARTCLGRFFTDLLLLEVSFSPISVTVLTWLTENYPVRWASRVWILPSPSLSSPPLGPSWNSSASSVNQRQQRGDVPPPHDRSTVGLCAVTIADSAAIDSVILSDTSTVSSCHSECHLAVSSRYRTARLHLRHRLRHRLRFEHRLVAACAVGQRTVIGPYPGKLCGHCQK